MFDGRVFALANLRAGEHTRRFHLPTSQEVPPFQARIRAPANGLLTRRGRRITNAKATSAMLKLCWWQAAPCVAGRLHWTCLCVFHRQRVVVALTCHRLCVGA